MRMLLKRAEGNGHEERENEKWEQMKTGYKSRITDEVIDRARVQVVVFFSHFSVFLLPLPVSCFKLRANGYNNMQQDVQTDATCNIQSSNNVVSVCMGLKGLFTWSWGTPGRWGNMLRVTPTYHVRVIKWKWEITCTGGLPHLSGLPHLPGVPHLHVNRPLVTSDWNQGSI